MKPHRLMAVTAAFVIGLSAGSYGSDTLDSAKAFKQMSELVGVWKPEGAANSTFSISFEFTANKTVLMETWLRGDKKHSLTVYHLDGENLLATHYCPQGNQPRLKMDTLSQDNIIKFSFMDATNLANTDQSHQHSLSFSLQQGGAILLRNETYLSGEGIDASELKLVRAGKATTQ